jgi:hypothetical protein
MSSATSTDSGWDRRRWLILGVIGLAQLMVVLDLTVMNVALPSAQRALGFTTVDRQWVVTAYTLAFGSLLLLGGRLADLLGRKVTFLAGLAGFAGVSAIGGASVKSAGDAALAELARRYLAAHAPAALEDFAAWSGLPVTWSRRAWKLLAESGVTAECGPLTMLAVRVQESTGLSDAPDVRMLPAFDNYLVGYRTREASVPALHQARVWPGGGLIRPTVIADGLAIATWTRTSGARSIQVEAFEPVPPAIQPGIDKEKTAVIGFLQPTA